MIPRLPFWMIQRQVKGQPVDETTLHLTAPQLPAYEVGVRLADDSSGWRAVLFDLSGPDGQKTLLAETKVAFTEQEDAWEDAFELYRLAVVI